MKKLFTKKSPWKSLLYIAAAKIIQFGTPCCATSVKYNMKCCTLCLQTGKQCFRNIVSLFAGPYGGKVELGMTVDSSHSKIMGQSQSTC